MGARAHQHRSRRHIGSGTYSAGLASTYSIQVFADGVRGSLERDVPITAYPKGTLVFDFYLDRPWWR